MTDCSLIPKNMYDLGGDNFYDKVRTLEFHKDRCKVNLNKLFQYMFGVRDAVFGGPEGYERWTKKGKVTNYLFSYMEFFETFLGSYPPEDVAGFLEEHLTDETLQSESLVTRVRRFKEENRIAFPERWWRHIKLAAYNFPVEELIEGIPKSMRTKSERAVWLTSCNFFGLEPDKWTGSRYKTTYHFKMKFGPREIRELLRNMDPPVVMISIDIGPKSLSLEDIAKFKYSKNKRVETIKSQAVL